MKHLRTATPVAAATLMSLIITTGALAATPPVIITDHFTWTDEYVEIGCYQPVLISEQGSAVIHITDGDEWIVFAGSFRISGSWSEDTDGDPSTPDEVFAGGVASAPLSWRVTPAETGGFTDIFTATVKGDQGTRGVFRYRAHLTVNANGEILAEFERFGGECRPPRG